MGGSRWRDGDTDRCFPSQERALKQAICPTHRACRHKVGLQRNFLASSRNHSSCSLHPQDAWVFPAGFLGVQLPDKQIRSLKAEQLLMAPGLALPGGPWQLGNGEGKEGEQEYCVGASPRQELRSRSD